MSQSGDPFKTGKYNHREISEELDHLNRQLEEMKESMLNTSVRAHIMEVELATLFSPEMAESLRNAQQNCDRCAKTLVETPATLDV